MQSTKHFFDIIEEYEVQAVCGTVIALIRIGIIRFEDGKFVFSGLEEQMLNKYFDDCKESYVNNNDDYVITTINKIIENQHIKDINTLFSKMRDIGNMILKNFH